MREWSWVQVQLKNPIGYVLRSKLNDTCAPKFYKEKPPKINVAEFELIPVYEVVTD